MTVCAYKRSTLLTLPLPPVIWLTASRMTASVWASIAVAVPGAGFRFEATVSSGGYFVDYLNQPFAQLDDNHKDDEHRNHAHHHEL